MFYFILAILHTQLTISNLAILQLYNNTLEILSVGQSNEYKNSIIVSLMFAIGSKLNIPSGKLCVCVEDPSAE